MQNSEFQQAKGVKNSKFGVLVPKTKAGLIEDGNDYSALGGKQRDNEIREKKNCIIDLALFFTFSFDYLHL